MKQAKESAGFIPNWKRLGLKSQKEGVLHVVNFVKREAKHIANRGYGETGLMDGYLNVLVNLKGSSNLKRKKEFIQV